MLFFAARFLQYRARLSRLQAALSIDQEAKRQLLRDAEASLRACISMDSADPRSYVVLGKLLVQQKRYDEARQLYADGTTATGMGPLQRVDTS